MNTISSNQAPIVEINDTKWTGTASPSQTYTDALEQGKVLYFPNLEFGLTDAERAILNPELVEEKRKNISFNINKNSVTGVAHAEHEQLVRNILERYYQSAKNLIEHILPEYQNNLLEPVNSLRVHEVSNWGASSSWRKDDARLHVDAFPSRPLQGKRILRIFNNINPVGVPRVWRVGEPFEPLAKAFLPKLSNYSPLLSWLQNSIGITKSKRSEYDHMMLQMHDAMKSDLDYQKNGQQWEVKFHPGATWICYSDQTPHAVMSGQYMLEQTFLVDTQSLKNPEQSPLKILERLTGKNLL